MNKCHRRQHFGVGFVAIIPKRKSQPATRFPFIRLNRVKDRVFGRAVVGMWWFGGYSLADFGDFVGAGLGEAVVDDAFGHGVVIISKQGAHIRAYWVADVVPHTGGAVAVGQFAPMSVGIGHIFGALGHRYK